MPQRSSSVKFIDLFSGIGGMRLGFESSGFKCVFSSEWDKYAQITYEANFNECPAGDITKIHAEDIPKHNVLVAGFPCQPFSKAGKQLGLMDLRGQMFFEIQRLLEYHRPEAFLLENVKRLKSHDNGYTFNLISNILSGAVDKIPQHVKLDKDLLKKLKFNLDYKIYSCILNAKDFGLPQNRERLYIVGFRKKLANDSKFEFKWPKPFFTETKVNSILQSNTLKTQRYSLSDALWMGHKRRKAQHIAKGNGFGYGLFSKTDPYTRTLSARYAKDGSEILISQDHLGLNPRKLTPRECANLQGFPKKFKVGRVSDTQMYKQFGNSVAVPVISAISREMMKSLKLIQNKVK